MYAQWRRRLEEAHFVYGRQPADHACWSDPSAPDCTMEVASRSSLYGCTRCGRSHYCQSPYTWCPRVVDPQSGEVRCGFSAHVLGTDAAVAMVPGGFHLEHAARHAMEEHSALMRDTSVRRAEHRIFSLGRGAVLRTSANYTPDMAKRRRLVAYADVSDATRVTVHEARQFLRLRASDTATDSDGSPLATAGHTRRDDHDHDNGDKGGEFIVGGVARDAALDDRFSDFSSAHHGGGGGDDADADDDYMPSITVTAADLAPVVPTLELERDDAYLSAYLAPVVAAFAPYVGLFTPRARADRAPPTAQTTMLARRLRFNLWPELSAVPVVPTQLLAHQQIMLRQIIAFVAEALALAAVVVGPAAAAAAPSPQDARAYLVLCDRLLLLHNSVVEPAAGFDRAKEPDLARLVSTMLTSVFSRDMHRPDAAHQAQLFVWLADPWLKWCRATANLFKDEALRARPGFARGARRPAVHGFWAPRLLDVLKSAPVSAHELYRFFHYHQPTPAAIKQQLYGGYDA